MPARPTVVVMFGGRSSEHGVSCVTASGVLGAIDRDRWNVIAVGVTREGQWTPVSANPADWRIRDGRMPEVPSGPETVLPPTRAGERSWDVATPEGVRPLAEVDVVFPLLHGPFGEDGTLQGALELVDVRYVGCGVLASAVAMDKHYAKTVLAAAGLPVAPGITLAPDDDLAARRAEIKALGLPVFVKPARAGSSMGVSRVDSWDALEAALATARKSDPKVLVEAAVAGREIECAVLATAHGVRVSPLGEIATGGDHDFYDFEAKYLDEAAVTLTCPVDLPDQARETVQGYARRAFAALGGEGLARVDCFVREDGSAVVNEVNTMPGFTPFSMYPRMWQAAGVEYPELVEQLLRSALERPVGLR